MGAESAAVGQVRALPVPVRGDCVVRFLAGIDRRRYARLDRNPRGFGPALEGVSIHFLRERSLHLTARDTHVQRDLALSLAG